MPYKLRQAVYGVWWIMTAYILMIYGNVHGRPEIGPMVSAAWIACVIGLWRVTKAFFFIESPVKRGYYND